MKKNLNQENLVSFKLGRPNRHFFHMVDNSPWPFITGWSVFFLLTGIGLWIHIIPYGVYFLDLIGWWCDVIEEGTYRGDHTLVVQRSLNWGLKLFILSEVMFFAGFFWSFFYFTFWLTYLTWPSFNYLVMVILATPFLNTVILIVSGFALTWAHRGVTEENSIDAIFGFLITLGLGAFFFSLQVLEYSHALFEISDLVFGSIFYTLTGLHGFHVTVGFIFLLVCFCRLLLSHFKSNQHLGFLFAIWYWHFVDVVWIFLFLVIYVWGIAWPSVWAGLILVSI